MKQTIHMTLLEMCIRDRGMAADLVLFSMIQPGYAGALTDPRGALLYCGNNHLADTTIVNGNVLIENGIFLAGDLNQIVEDANRSTARILKRCV